VKIVGLMLEVIVLSAELRQADIIFQRFNRLLKTFSFGCWDRGALWL